MRGRALLVLSLALVLAAGGIAAAAGDPPSDTASKEQIDARIARLRGEIQQAGARQGVLTSQLSDVTATLRDAQTLVDRQQAHVSLLELALGRAHSRVLHADGLLRRRTRFLRFSERLDLTARSRLERRLRVIYMHGQPDVLSVMLSAASFAEAVDDVEYVRRIARQDRRIAIEARRAHRGAVRARAAAARARRDAAARTAELARRTDAAARARDRLVASRDAVAAAKRVKADALASARADRQAYLDEVNGLEAQSAALAARIRAAQAGGGFTPPDGTPGRLAWPVSGPVTSPFGMRWGRRHDGIDIGVGLGTPVHAAAAGRVVYAGWMSGYGNLVVLDHGSGLSTAYGHNTSLEVGVGQDVAAGQVIALSGSTGHSTGPHVHFEVRVNGEPVDPLGYL